MLEGVVRQVSRLLLRFLHASVQEVVRLVSLLKLEVGHRQRAQVINVANWLLDYRLGGYLKLADAHYNVLGC